MSESLRSRIRVFDPHSEYAITMRKLPHWSQAGTLSFITWRTWDSIPEPVLVTWLEERDAWLTQRGIDPARADWRAQLQMLESSVLHEFKLQLSDRWNDQLDKCQGACVLRQQEL